MGRGRGGAGAPRGLWRLRPPPRNAPGRRSTPLHVRTANPADGLRPAGQSSASSPDPPWWQRRRCHRHDLAFPALRPIPAAGLRRLARTPRSWGHRLLRCSSVRAPSVVDVHTSSIRIRPAPRSGAHSHPRADRTLGLTLVGRQGDDESRAASAGGALQSRRAAVRLGDGSNDRQSKP